MTAWALLLPEPKRLFPNFDGLYVLPVPEWVELDTEDSLTSIRGHVGCDYVDVVTTSVKGVDVDIWLDDEGLLVGKVRQPQMGELTGRHLVGSGLVCQATPEGDTVGLSDLAIGILADRFCIAPPMSHPPSRVGVESVATTGREEQST